MSKKGQNAKKSQPIVKAPISNETLTETLEQPKPEIPNEPLTEIPVKKSERRVFWHKACKDIKESTMTKMKPEESLTYTENKANDDQGNVKEVLSLKRGKRIYYTIDYTLDELTLAQQSFNEKQALKEAEKKAKEELKEKEKEDKKKK
jgi:hypothetical protein